jgi:hypothetical protein
MSILIGSWEFEGPYNEITELRAEPGIVALLSCANDEVELIAIDESESVKDYLEKKAGKGARRYDGDRAISTAVYYCSDLNATLRQGLIDRLIKEFEDIVPSPN